MAKVKVVTDLGNAHGNLGSVLVRKDGRYYVVSSASTPAGPQTHAFRSSRTGKVTNWREVAGDYGMTREQVIAELDELCHCGSPMRGSDHCPFCGCEEYEAYCDEDWTPGQEM
jgi:hypothetical protein